MTELLVQRLGRTSASVCGVLILGLALAACSRAEAPLEKPAMLVRTQTVQLVDYAPQLSLTGEIRARTETPLAFRVSGQIIDRSVDVGDHVEAGQVLAHIDAQEQQADVDAAQAAVSAAEAQMRQASSAFERQKSLLAQGVTTRSSYDQANASMLAAQGSLEVATAQLDNAREIFTYTELRATAPGIIIERNGEVGEVAQVAQPIYVVAEDGPRDAVFDVQEAVFLAQPDDTSVALALISDPNVSARGTVREVSPTIDPRTGTVQVKIAIENIPGAMSLRAPVQGSIRAKASPRVVLPWSALWSEGSQPAVWIVDPATHAVSLRPVGIASYDTDTIILESGLEPGDIVVVEGAKLLRPQQVVTIAEGVPA